MESDGSSALSAKLVRLGLETVAKMIVLKLSIVILAGQLVSGAPSGPPDTSIYDGVWENTMIKDELASLRMGVEEQRSSVRDLDFPVGATIRVNEFNIILKKTAIRLADVTIDYLEAFENVVATGNIPAEEIFEKFERLSRRLRRFLANEAGKFVHETRELIGCQTAREFDAVFESFDHQVEYIALALHRIREAVKSKENKSEYVERQATIVFNRVVKLKAVIESHIYESLKMVVERIWLANTVQGILFIFQDNANQSVNEIIQTGGTLLVDLNVTTQNVYIEGQQAIRENLNTAITELSVFENSKKLSRLTHEINQNYHRLYNFLNKQNRTDLGNINRYYKMLYENSVDVIQKIADIVQDATNRTTLEYLDLYMNGYFEGVEDCSGSVYVLEAYSDIIQNINQCLQSELMTWTATIDAFSAGVKLLQTASNTVAASTTRCVNEDFATDPTLFARSKACLKTNIQDSARLVEILEPQFVDVDKLIKQNVEVSKFRLENCLATGTHEITAMLRTSRSLIRACTRRIEECPIEEIYEDDEGELYERYREAAKKDKKDGPKKSFLKTTFKLSEDFRAGTNIDSEEATS